MLLYALLLLKSFHPLRFVCFSRRIRWIRCQEAKPINQIWCNSRPNHRSMWSSCPSFNFNYILSKVRILLSTEYASGHFFPLDSHLVLPDERQDESQVHRSEWKCHLEALLHFKVYSFCILRSQWDVLRWNVHSPLHWRTSTDNFGQINWSHSLDDVHFSSSIDSQEFHKYYSIVSCLCQRRHNWHCRSSQRESI